MTSPPESNSVGQTLRPLRDLATYTLVGATGIWLLVAIIDLIPDGSGQFGGRTEGSFGEFVNLPIVAFPIAAVLLALMVQPRHPKARLIVLAALLEYAVAAFFGVFFGLLIGLINLAADAGARAAFMGLLVRLGWLAVLAVPAYAVFLIWQRNYSAPKPPRPAPGVYGQQPPFNPGAYPGQPGYGPQPGGHPGPPPGGMPGGMPGAPGGMPPGGPGGPGGMPLGGPGGSGGPGGMPPAPAGFGGTTYGQPAPSQGQPPIPSWNQPAVPLQPHGGPAYPPPGMPGSPMAPQQSAPPFSAPPFGDHPQSAPPHSASQPSGPPYNESPHSAPPYNEPPYNEPPHSAPPFSEPTQVVAQHPADDRTEKIDEPRPGFGPAEPDPPRS